MNSRTSSGRSSQLSYGSIRWLFSCRQQKPLYSTPCHNASVFFKFFQLFLRLFLQPFFTALFHGFFSRRIFPFFNFPVLFLPGLYPCFFPALFSVSFFPVYIPVFTDPFFRFFLPGLFCSSFPGSCRPADHGIVPDFSVDCQSITGPGVLSSCGQTPPV